MKNDSILYVSLGISNINNANGTVSAGNKSLFIQHSIVYEGCHLIGDAIRGFKSEFVEDFGFKFGMILPNLYCQGEKTGVSTFEFVETLHIITQHNELKRTIHIHCVFNDELKIEKGHILRLVNYNHILFGNVNAGWHISRQNVADAGVRVGRRIVIFDGKTVISVDV